MVLVFDMDDTLYDELSYVRSGFASVARMLEPICEVAAAILLKDALALLKHKGRGRVFDRLLEKNGCHSVSLATRCVRHYRTHEPRIALWPEAALCLKRHAGLSLYVVSDGNAVAQQAKARALGLHRLTKRVLLTHRFGVRHAKPSPYCFERIAQWENARPESVTYIADNPAKDFVGIRTQGFRTIRVRTGQYAEAKANRGYDAERTVASLAELDFTA